MPAGFTTDGLPVGVELLGGAFTEATLLKFAYSWEQSAKPRRAPFSTPPLVDGVAPLPASFETTVGAGAVKFTYDRTTGALRYDATTAPMGSDRVVGLTLQRSSGDQPGPIIAHLLVPNQISGAGTLTLRGRDRDDLVAGKLYAHFYTRQAPLGAARTQVLLPQVR
jgi:hypothetical protein